MSKKTITTIATAAAVSLTLAFGGGAVSAKGGANNSGPYTNDCQTTQDCEPSRNGNGNGKATGRPAAGSVGNADTKNPPGQVKKLPVDADGNPILEYPAQDGDSGYECDSNNGIGKGNPAHSPCTGGDNGDDDNGDDDNGGDDSVVV